MSEKKQDLLAALEELKSASTEHHRCQNIRDAADRELTSAVNRLNKAQRTVDELMAELRKNAPWNTDWHSQRKHA